MTKIITKTDFFKKSILHRDTIIHFKGEEKLKNEISPYLRLKTKNYIAKSFLKNKFDKESLIAEGWEFKPKTKHTKTKWRVTKPKNESAYFEDRVWSFSF